MKEVAPEDRPKVGQIVNETRQAIEEVLATAKKELAAKKRELQMKAEVIDVTLPAKKAELGHKHPNMLAREEIEKIFIGMGYEVVEGPEVEYDYYNFEALNIPANHPAKMNRIHSISMIKLFLEHRHHLFRQELWKRQTSNKNDFTWTCIQSR